MIPGLFQSNYNVIFQSLFNKNVILNYTICTNYKAIRRFTFCDLVQCLRITGGALEPAGTAVSVRWHCASPAWEKGSPWVIMQPRPCCGWKRDSEVLRARKKWWHLRNYTNEGLVTSCSKNLCFKWPLEGAFGWPAGSQQADSLADSPQRDRKSVV